MERVPRHATVRLPCGAQAQVALLQVVAALLHLSNVRFVEKADEAGASSVAGESAAAMAAAEALLGTDDMATKLMTRVVAVRPPSRALPLAYARQLADAEGDAAHARDASGLRVGVAPDDSPGLELSDGAML